MNRREFLIASSIGIVELFAGCPRRTDKNQPRNESSRSGEQKIAPVAPNVQEQVTVYDVERFGVGELSSFFYSLDPIMQRDIKSCSVGEDYLDTLSRILYGGDWLIDHSGQKIELGKNVRAEWEKYKQR